jgi:hypothetical protein
MASRTNDSGVGASFASSREVYSFETEPCNLGFAVVAESSQAFGRRWRNGARHSCRFNAGNPLAFEDGPDVRKLKRGKEPV